MCNECTVVHYISIERNTSTWFLSTLPHWFTIRCVDDCVKASLVSPVQDGALGRVDVVETQDRTVEGSQLLNACHLLARLAGHTDQQMHALAGKVCQCLFACDAEVGVECFVYSLFEKGLEQALSVLAIFAHS